MASNVNSFLASSIGETVGHAVSRLLSYFFQKKTSYGTSNSVILEMYYKYTVYFILFFYMSLQYNCYYAESIRCVSTVAGDENAADHHLNYCLSYSRHPDSDKAVAFYKWLPWTLVGLMIYFYFIKKVMKSCDCRRIPPLMSDETAVPEELQRDNECFYYHLLAHSVALLMNGFSVFAINFCLQDIFWDLVPASFPFQRDYKTFRDPLSTRFSPFTVCTIGQNILYGRKIEYRCHLIYMEYYEKFLVLLWLWLVALGILNLLYILYLCVRRVRCGCTTIGGTVLRTQQIG